MLPDVVLEMAHPNPSSTIPINLPFPQAGIIRKTGTGQIFLQNSHGNIVTNRSLLEIAGGTVSVEPSSVGSFL